MKTKIKINSIFGKLLFEFEKEDNSVKETLLEAIRLRTDLRYANLEDANLRNANLRDANLRDANLVRANLEDANLRNANLRNANLEDANLEDARMPVFCKWYVSNINGTDIKIGCKTKSIEDWDAFFASNEVYDTPRNTEVFKRIEALYLAHRAYVLHLNVNNLEVKDVEEINSKNQNNENNENNENSKS